MNMQPTSDMLLRTDHDSRASGNSKTQAYGDDLQGLHLFSALSIKLPWILGILISVVTIGHYLTPQANVIVHNVLQRLYYIPIIWAAYRYGIKGGLIVSLISGIMYLPHTYLWMAISSGLPVKSDHRDIAFLRRWMVHRLLIRTESY